MSLLLALAATATVYLAVFWIVGWHDMRTISRNAAHPFEHNKPLVRRTARSGW